MGSPLNNIERDLAQSLYKGALLRAIHIANVGPIDGFIMLIRWISLSNLKYKIARLIEKQIKWTYLIKLYNQVVSQDTNCKLEWVQQ